ncbi:MAG: methyl-accepting chemotaxis protein [Geobacter sp.]|jgi:methyl-accepting chemotaxis protein|uniref:methyl-accepting chemotaxis protein n=1 Tax=Trichlorobacter sp. TaxID=2911007 RepID=UPI002A35AE26|nr:methyl-accepting chemotaxis protein [Trichlorobacter sp.]MDY0384298.1 methyl-accepting chemotaxis protein [Trichlorobacter sp.]
MLQNMKIGTKLTAGFLFVALVALVIGLGGYVNLHRIDSGSVRIYTQVAQPLGDLTLLSAEFQRVRVNSHKMLSIDDIDEHDLMVDRSNELIDIITKRSLAYEKTLINAEDKKLFANFNKALNEYKTQLTTFNKLIMESNKAAANELIVDEYDYAARELQVAIEKLVETKMAQGKQVSGNNNTLARNASIFMVALALGGSVLAFLLGMFLSRMITRPLAALADDAQQIASGDLTVQIQSRSKDEIGVLATSFNSMADSLRGAIRQVSDTSSLLTSAANELLATSESISSGADSVASQAQTVATAGEEMAATSNDIANNCQSAAAGALDASTSASDGSVVVDKTVQAMGQIARRVKETADTVARLGQRSDQIGQIVGTIEDIADQTNLLALNAAIEAARAGEQGRGFAVVADEVRALAERTTRATKEISDMIRSIQAETRSAVTVMEEGVHEVAQGTDEAAKSGVALQTIMELVNNVSMQISQVATAAEEQTATTNEISQNMLQITDVVQQTAQGAKQSEAAAAELSKLAADLEALVHRFKL